ncbi:hypothetical protein BS47DRAFT_1398092 [Hydnum rufescens UP504]|uniref:Uncharacterized protein n=1 Tax=Hydnum rufescens UP504 TaxID=1448309 RepID=A0A9P6ALK6_9AGAM|nr:hypothetical protein BS47DRAFT_1398092 [Hydnum rufescens UP504]
MVKTDLEDMKQATEGAGLSHLMAAEQDGMLKRAQCIGEVGVHTIILMVTGQAHDDKSTAWNGIFYRTDASRRFWSSINSLISQLLWQFYIFVNNDTLQLEKPELDLDVVQAKVWSTELTDISKAKASSGKHLRRLLEPFVTLKERFPWQDHNASNSVGGWHLLCSKFHKKPADITIAVRRWSAGSGKKCQLHELATTCPVLVSTMCPQDQLQECLNHLDNSPDRASTMVTPKDKPSITSPREPAFNNIPPGHFGKPDRPAFIDDL